MYCDVWGNLRGAQDTEKMSSWVVDESWLSLGSLQRPNRSNPAFLVAFLVTPHVILRLSKSFKFTTGCWFWQIIINYFSYTISRKQWSMINTTFFVFITSAHVFRHLFRFFFQTPPGLRNGAPAEPWLPGDLPRDFLWDAARVAALLDIRQMIGPRSEPQDQWWKKRVFCWGTVKLFEAGVRNLMTKLLTDFLVEADFFDVLWLYVVA